MQEYPSWNKYICIINEQTNNCAPNPYNLYTMGLRPSTKKLCESRNEYTNVHYLLNKKNRYKKEG